MSLKDVLIDELRDLYSAENQLIKALPKLAKGAKDPDLKKGFSDHLEETKAQVLRLREAFEVLGKKPTGKHCEGMEGVIDEGAEALEEKTDKASYDSGLIAAALRTEHYEMAGYHVAIEMAKALGLNVVANLLDQNLREETDTARKLLAHGKIIFKAAIKEKLENKDAKPASQKKASEKTSEKKSKEDEKKAAPDVAKKKKKEDSKKGKKKASAASKESASPAVKSEA